MKKIQTNSSKFICIVLGFLATLMIFLPVLVLKDSDTSYTGLQVAFGVEFANLGSWASGEIAFNPMVLLAFLLPAIAAIVIMSVSKGNLIAGFLFIVATALILMIPQFTTVTVTLLGDVNEIDVEWTYGMGLMIAAGLSAVGAFVSMFSAYKKV